MTKITVKHPDYGHVIFTNPTARQIEILEHYRLLIRNRERIRNKMKEELIKLVIEKGFNGVLFDDSIEDLNANYKKYVLALGDKDYYLWLSLLQKWLREEYGIHITIKYLDGLFMYGFKIENILINEIIYKENYNSKTPYTYEQVLEKGLLEALKLINV